MGASNRLPLYAACVLVACALVQTTSGQVASQGQEDARRDWRRLSPAVNNNDTERSASRLSGQEQEPLIAKAQRRGRYERYLARLVRN